MKRRRNLFMTATLMCGFMVFAFQFDQNSFSWMWEEQEPIALILGLTASVFGVFWYREQRRMKLAK